MRLPLSAANYRCAVLRQYNGSPRGDFLRGREGVFCAIYSGPPPIILQKNYFSVEYPLIELIKGLRQCKIKIKIILN